jgi:guanine deaminase
MNPKHMKEAVLLSIHKMKEGFGGPFGAVVVKDGEIISRGFNKVTSTNDPTAHAEVVAIREACMELGSFDLKGCELYTSCEPCPMCLGAIYWARPDVVYYSNTKSEAAEAGFDDEFIYKELEVPLADRKIPLIQLKDEESIKAFEEWKKLEGRVDY